MRTCSCLRRVEPMFMATDLAVQIDVADMNVGARGTSDMSATPAACVATIVLRRPILLEILGASQNASAMTALCADMRIPMGPAPTPYIVLSQSGSIGSTIPAPSPIMAALDSLARVPADAMPSSILPVPL